ncbi:Uncharacterised protein [Vibrio cholerae]|nr:Uncharacterised protein [Vibrio cholerae]
MRMVNCSNKNMALIVVTCVPSCHLGQPSACMNLAVTSLSSK